MSYKHEIVLLKQESKMISIEELLARYANSASVKETKLNGLPGDLRLAYSIDEGDDVARKYCEPDKQDCIDNKIIMETAKISSPNKQGDCIYDRTTMEAKESLDTRFPTNRKQQTGAILNQESEMPLQELNAVYSQNENKNNKQIVNRYTMIMKTKKRVKVLQDA